ncbi:MAG: hypothetical protein ACRD3V_12490, partial [Vicinamibacteria bacterium]
GPAQTPAALPSFTDVVSISANGNQYRATSFAVKADGTAWGWGHGQYGKLGNGTTTNQTAPTQVSTSGGTMTGVVAVAAGLDHTLALTSSGSVWAWGLRANGALGDNSTSGHATEPQQVSGLTNVVAIAAGYQFSMALKSDGSLAVWGVNGAGQLGDGTTTNRLTPISVPNLSGIAAIAAGHSHAFALESDGTGSNFLWAWGNNDGGKLGDGTTTDRSTPIRVAQGIRRISGSEGTSLVLEEDSGFLKAVLGAGSHYGNNADSTAPSTSDRFITILRDDFVDVSAGASIQLALRADTMIREWGSLMATGADGDLLGDDTGIHDDPDEDGLTNGEEWTIGTDPFDSDTNDDGILDGIAVASGMSPTDPDMDDDGVLNGAERTNGTDPFNFDTDGDEVGDGDDAFPIDPERDEAPDPTPGDITPPTITLTEPTNATLISSNP